MAQVEWNKKEELVAEQAIKHLKKYSLVLAAVAKSLEAEIKLIVKVQEYCYENMVFMKVFQKIIVLFYKSEYFEDFYVACYRVAMTYRDHFSLVCLSVSKLVWTTSQKLLVQFHPNFTGLLQE